MSAFADSVIVDGWIFTAGMERPALADIAIAGERIMAVAEAGGLADLIGPTTTVRCAAGELIVPGFQDAHIHPVFGGTELLQCDLTAATSAADCYRLIRQYCADRPEPEWIIGAGWSMEFFPGGTPTRQALDAATDGRPAAILNRDHHGIWVNSRALELAGITRETPDPGDGRVERDSAGNPSGTLHEGASDAVTSILPKVTDELADLGLRTAQAYLHELGVTAWQDAMLGIGLGTKDATDTYLAALAAGELTMRVVGAQWWERDGGLEQVDSMIERRDRIAAADPTGRFRASSVKIMVDGVAENFTAALSAPYRDATGRATANSGLSFIPPRNLKRYVTALDAAGFQVHFHALGDRAVTEALNAIKAARTANGDRGNRHHLAHLQWISSADIPRFAKLGAVANLQMLWAMHEDQLDELTIPFIEPGLVDRLYPFGELAESGATLAAGSDWPVSTPDPLAAIHIGVNRTLDPANAPPLGGVEQRLTLADALTAYTFGSAFVNGLEGDTGRIQAGYLADLVVIDRNLFAFPTAQIGQARVRLTLSGGRVVYDRDQAPARRDPAVAST
ncbi:MAG TPA: amidohydrolase [Terrimesophilobacter sp.]|nr:amidohydrolase [Terrimesophilobacter sp.]